MSEPEPVPETATAADRELLDHLAITRLVGRYADVVTRRAWPELTPLFEAAATVVVDTHRGDPIELLGASAVADFIGRSVERFDFFELVPLNVVTELDGDTATARCYQVEVRQDHASGRRTDAFGLYTDRFVRTGGTWRFVARRYRSLARDGADLAVFDPP
jgi:hypothetical protein